MVTKKHNIFAVYSMTVTIVTLLIGIVMLKNPSASLPAIAIWFLAPGTLAALITGGVHSDYFMEVVFISNAPIYIGIGVAFRAFLIQEK